MQSRQPAQPDPAMQRVVDDLGITREEAGRMIRAGLEQARIGARLYGMFVAGEVKEPLPSGKSG